MVGSPMSIRRSFSNKSEEMARVKRFYQDLAELRKKTTSDSESGYLPFDLALQFARDHQSDDIESPSQPFAAGLLSQISEILMERYGYEDVFGEDLHFYSAVNTPLDTFHGIDAWVEILDRRTQKYRRVTLDVTQNTQKLEEGHKADVIVPVLQDYPQPPRTRALTESEKVVYLKEKSLFEAKVRGIAEQILLKAFKK